VTEVSRTKQAIEIMEGKHLLGFGAISVITTCKYDGVMFACSSDKAQPWGMRTSIQARNARNRYMPVLVFSDFFV
jgi:hypothetical protein